MPMKKSNAPSSAKLCKIEGERKYFTNEQGLDSFNHSHDNTEYINKNHSIKVTGKGKGKLVSANLGKLNEDLAKFLLVSIIVVEVIQYRSGKCLVQKLQPRTKVASIINQLNTNLRNRGYSTYQKISSKRTPKDEKKAADTLQGYCSGNQILNL